MVRFFFTKIGLEVVMVLYGAISYQPMKKAAISISQHNPSPEQTSKPSAPEDET